MKKLFRISLLFLCCAAGAQTNVIFFRVGDILSGSGSPNLLSQKVVLTDTSDNPRLINGIYISPQPKTVYTHSDGKAYFTNVVWGTYNFGIVSSPEVSFDFQVQTNTTGLVDGASLTGVTNQPNPVSNFYTIAQVNALFASIATNGSALIGITASNLINGPIPSGLLTSGTTNGAGHLLIISNGYRYVTYDGSRLTNLNADVAGAAAAVGTNSTNFALLVGNNNTNFTINNLSSLSNVVNTSIAALGQNASNTFQGASATLTNWSGRSTNQFAVVPVSATATHFVAFGANTNLLTDSLVGSNSFDLSGVAVTVGANDTNYVLQLSNNIVVPTQVFVANTGSDSTGAGTLAAPFLTITNALRSIRSNGIVMLRGGYYTNLQFVGAGLRGVKIIGYPSEMVTNLFLVNKIGTNSLVSTGSNGAYTNTPSATWSNAYVSTTNFFINAKLPLFQFNTPYGTQGSNNFYQPPLLMGDDGNTNRCFHYPLMFSPVAASALANSNGYFAYSNGLLTVKFAVSNVPGDIVFPSTNVADCFVSGCDQNTDVEIRNVFVEFGYKNFDITGAGSFKLIDSLAYGGDVGNVSCVPGSAARHIELRGCEFVGALNNDVDLQGVLGNSPTAVIIDGCYFHDDFNVALHISGGSHGYINNCYIFGGTNEIAGYVSDGANVRIYNSDVMSMSGASSSQMGASSPIDRKSYIGWHSGYIENSSTGPGLEMDDHNDTFNGFNLGFDILTGAPVNVNGTIATHNAHTFGSVAVGLLQTSDLIAAGAHIPSYTDPQFSSHIFAYGSTVWSKGDFYEGVDSTAGLIADNYGRLTLGLKVGGGPTPIVIDGSANFFPNSLSVTNGSTFNIATATNGIATEITNTLVFSSVSSCTNTLGHDGFASVSAGTSVILKDQNGNTIDTIGTVATIHIAIPMRDKERLSGTAISCVIH